MVRVREIQPGKLLVFDTYAAQETIIDTKQLKQLLRDGIWRSKIKRLVDFRLRRTRWMKFRKIKDPRTQPAASVIDYSRLKVDCGLFLLP